MLDEFAGDSGLRDDWDGTITAAEFEQQQRGNYALKIHVTADDGDDQEYYYSVGGADKGWTSYDGGETIQGPTAKSRFHVNSSMQGFIDSVMRHEEAAKILRERSAEKYQNKGPFHAALWLGLRFHWDVVEEVGRRQQGGEWVEAKVQVVRPTRFLGVVDEGNRPAAKSKGSPAIPDNGEVSDADLATLTKLAIASDSHGSFVDSVMETQFSNGEAGLKNKPIMKLISKKDWYEGIKG